MTKLSVKDFYQNKTLLVTGITGFVGKVLLAKLLQKFSKSLKCIYVLVREKKSQTAEQRLTQLFLQSPVFERHKDNIKLVHAINGDITAKDMAISEHDRHKLIEEVNVVIHCAATVNFTGIFEKFIQQNIDGTDSLLRLCEKMNHLESIVYVSTAYGNCHLKEIEEKIYPVIPGENFDSYLEYLKQNYSNFNFKKGHHALLGRPNPYTLSKSITEWMIQERYSSLPVIICRPSIVSNSFEEPIPGWCDSVAGCSGAAIMTALGIARSIIFDENCKADIIPVDMVVNSLIIAGAYRASPLFSEDKQVIHVTLGQNQLTWGEFFRITINFSDTLPPMKLIRPIKMRSNKHQSLMDRINYRFTMIFSHYLFAYVIDCICIVVGQKPFMIKLIKRLNDSSHVLKPFSCNEWNFRYENLKFITNLLDKCERDDFCTDTSIIHWHPYLYNFILGCRRYILNDPDSTLQLAINRQHRIKFLLIIMKIIIALLCYWLIRSSIHSDIFDFWLVDTSISIAISLYFSNFYD
ncbi:fatty acyl-CoA reductase 1-like [Dermatophagoides pteronyssinus]|uniref:fatty acyl-CoA reductase 1-like n=1 Tax=Dermatophagoides pteronyssinus TaxID=6956 RepID=UPI003F668C1D